MGDRIEVVVGSGNVFADLGLPDPDIRLVKAALTYRIYRIVRERAWTQEQDAEAFVGIDQAMVSALLRGRLAEFSIERLFRFLIALDQDIEISVRPNPPLERPASVTVAAD